LQRSVSRRVAEVEHAAPTRTERRKWERIAIWLPPLETNATYYKDHRLILNGILFRLQIGCPSRNLPESYGPWSTVASGFRRWTRAGLWDRLLELLRRELDTARELRESLVHRWHARPRVQVHPNSRSP